MEEYEPHINRGAVVYAGVDYHQILDQAEKEADIILWDGGNNDTPFYFPDLMITVVDPHRAGHETRYFPGETNLRMADVVVINKIDTAIPEDVKKVQNNIREINPEAIVIRANSPITVEDSKIIKGKQVLVVEDGPTVTHGEMKYGAGVVAARKYGASHMVNPRPFAIGSIVKTFEKYPDIGTLLPAMGYGEKQIKDLEETINRTPCDVVIIGTPIDLRRIIKINKPSIRVTYELKETGTPTLKNVLESFTK
jgi:predicted GTPase